MPLVPILNGQDGTADVINALIDNVGVTRYQTADQTRTSSTTYLDSPDLVFPLTNNAGYVFRSTLFCSSGTTPDIKFRLTLPSLAFGRVAWGDGTFSAEDDASDIIEQAFSTSGAALEAITPSGYIATSSAGNLTVGFAQNTSNASTTTFRLGSFLTVIRVA